jgi:hypothetical protein
MNKYAQQLFNQIDELNEKIRKIEENKRLIFVQLALYKKHKEEQYTAFIGKKAICTNYDNAKPFECVCTKVIILDDYETIKCLFSRNGKKCIVESYEFL